MRPLFVVVLLVAACMGICLGTTAFAQDQETAASSDIAFPAEAAIRARDIKFEVSDTPFPMQLFAADPKLLEQKYVATIQFESGERTVERGAANIKTNELRELFNSTVLNPMQLQSGVSGVIRLLYENVPVHRRPGNELMSSLLNPHHVRLGYVRGTQ